MLIVAFRTCLGRIPVSSQQLQEPLWTLPEAVLERLWPQQSVPRPLLDRPRRDPVHSWTCPPTSLERPRALRTLQDRSKIDFRTIFGRVFVDFAMTGHRFQAARTRIMSDLAIDEGANSASQKRAARSTASVCAHAVCNRFVLRARLSKTLCSTWL